MSFLVTAHLEKDMTCLIVKLSKGRRLDWISKAGKKPPMKVLSDVSVTIGSKPHHLKLCRLDSIKKTASSERTFLSSRKERRPPSGEQLHRFGTGGRGEEGGSERPTGGLLAFSTEPGATAIPKV